MDITLLNTVLGDLTKLNSEIEGIAIVSSDGLVLVARLPEYINESNLGLVAAAFVSLGIRTDIEVKMKEFKQVVINNNEGDVVMTCLDQENILLVVTRADINREQLQKEMKEVANKIRKALK